MSYVAAAYAESARVVAEVTPHPVQMRGEQMETMGRIEPLLDELHSQQQIAEAIVDMGDGSRRTVEAAPYYMNNGDKIIADGERPGVWKVTERDGEDNKTAEIIISRTPGPRGVVYEIAGLALNRRGLLLLDGGYVADRLDVLDRLASMHEQAKAMAAVQAAEQQQTRQRSKLWSALGSLLGFGRNGRDVMAEQSI